MSRRRCSMLCGSVAGCNTGWPSGLRAKPQTLQVSEVVAEFAILEAPLAPFYGQSYGQGQHCPATQSSSAIQARCWAQVPPHTSPLSLSPVYLNFWRTVSKCSVMSALVRSCPTDCAIPLKNPATWFVKTELTLKIMAPSSKGRARPNICSDS